MRNIFDESKFLEVKNNQIINNFPNNKNNFEPEGKRKLENEAYFNIQNNPKNLKFSPPTQFLKNRIIENLSDNKYPTMNNVPIFDVKQVMKINSDNKKNLAQMNLEYLNSINLNNLNNRKNSFDQNLFKQNYCNYGMINNNINLQNYPNMNNQINFNLMKKHFEKINVNGDNNENFTKKLETNSNNQKILINNFNEFKQFNNFNNDNPYSMMMAQNYNRLKENHLENISKNAEKLEKEAISKSKIKSNPKSETKKIKKPFIEREGDWVCHQCKNLNFSFRVFCNRCQLSKDENETLKSKPNVNEEKL